MLCVLDGPRPSKGDVMKLRAYMLLYVKQLVLKGSGINDDELQSMLNYLTTVQEVCYHLSKPDLFHPEEIISSERNGEKTGKKY